MFVSRNGYTGFNFEHSWGDGVAVARFMQEICRDVTDNPMPIPPSQVTSSSAVKKISFQLNDKLKAAVSTAKANYKSRYDRCIT